MKTLAEYMGQVAQQTASAEERWRAACDALLADVERRSPPVFQSPSDSTDFAAVRDGLRAALRSYKGELLGVACDHCGAELMNPPGCGVLFSDPPQKYARCPGCGFCGYLRTSFPRLAHHGK